MVKASDCLSWATSGLSSSVLSVQLVNKKVERSIKKKKQLWNS